MKIIDLLNKIANGEDVPKKIRIDHWCYNFEWIEHESNYYDRNAEIDLMSCLSMDKEELNYEVEIIEEDKKIEKLNTDRIFKRKYLCDDISIDFLKADIMSLSDKINELIDKVNNMENN